MTRPNRPNIALLVFSLSSQREAIRKAFGRSGAPHTANIGLFDALIERTEAVARQSGLDLIWVDERQQQGNSFGEKLSHAFESLFEQGYDRVISIGNDSPDLTADLIRQAADALTSGTPVLGPSLDGGVYLIGLHRDDFQADQFRALPWMSDKVCHALAEAVATTGADVHWLIPLQDLDHRRDLVRFLTLQPFHSLRSAIQRLISEGTPTAAPPVPSYLQPDARSLTHPRAPPVMR